MLIRPTPVRLAVFLAVSLAILSTACTPTPAQRVTGQDSSSPTWTRGQSETAIALSTTPDNVNTIVVAFNDDTNTESTIVYTENTRQVLPGASELGWAYSDDQGATWTWGGKVLPPDGWAVIWSDPAITALSVDGTPDHPESFHSHVFISMLAADNAHFPPGGITGEFGTSGGVEFERAITGACIARSTDGGHHFAAWGCIDSSDGGSYDGGTAASDSTGNVYFAYWKYNPGDASDVAIEVWTADGRADRPTFQLVGDVFLGAAAGHPQLRVSPADDTLWLAAPVQRADGTFTTMLTGYPTIATAYTPTWSDPIDLAPEGTFEPEPDISVGPYALRTARQFSFDIGRAASPRMPSDGWQIRYALTTGTGDRNIEAGLCDLVVRDHCAPEEFGPGRDCYFPTSCNMVPAWALSLPGDQFNPDIATWAGRWKLAFLSRQDDPTGNTLSVVETSLVGGSAPAALPITVVPTHSLCTDKRGYWGDYDDLVAMHWGGSTAPPPTVQSYIRAFTDSSAGCDFQWWYDSAHVHVSSVEFQ